MSDPQKQPGRVDAVAKAIAMLDAGAKRKETVMYLREELGYGITAANRYVKDAIRLRFERDHELGGADVQDMRQRLTARAWERSSELHSKAITCLQVGDELDNDAKVSNITERGSRLAKEALSHERTIAGYYHLDKIAPDYDLSSDETREFVARAVSANAEAFDTPALIQIANAAASALSTRPHLNEEQHREAMVSDRVRALLEQKRASEPN